ncbi:4-hydroxyphenylacetate 3-monooxygenase [Rhizobium wenxiniae]|uniref:Flavin reductase (DIM6/NTAB) family NADH-FMN oxidoreductase RutF n=1 Tax=Rhizobium wenxiniae TaxID=1737357 RepID=A0A7W9YB40_9HYPH|nr:flavin reductase family protein [Rhizobium wenxiniae]MBB6165261.1 flavin reductase (DIM6/NTAB) family NADH-FMN oxidoreductase RutF [Rhizobium wenxiniae]GGG14000.1 4-hydroxyphenylacetate 3-monooxygenase [Rhizobium wenxiniae]
MMALTGAPETVKESFRASMRITAASVSLITTTDGEGAYHGMAVTSAVSLSMDPPSMLVAVNRSASIHPFIVDNRRFCLNLMGDTHFNLLESFSRTDLRDRRFLPEHWLEGPGGMPVLRGALASQVCSVADAHHYDTHTIFVGMVEHVLLPTPSEERLVPLVWMNGCRASLASSQQSKP